jgi:hypothetical protein
MKKKIIHFANQYGRVECDHGRDANWSKTIPVDQKINRWKKCTCPKCLKKKPEIKKSTKDWTHEDVQQLIKQIDKIFGDYVTKGNNSLEHHLVVGRVMNCFQIRWLAASTRTLANLQEAQMGQINIIRREKNDRI